MSSPSPSSKRRKTWKREIAVAVLAAYSGAYGWTLYALSWAPAENASQMVTMINGAAPWVAALVAGAFGLDGYAKQIKGQDDADQGHSGSFDKGQLLRRGD